jgi:anaerobic magnesium-protoporphyrin IX monomethyl ester cyclase
MRSETNMKTLLIGADYEENLGIAMIAASLRRSGHRVNVLAFDDATTTDEVAQAVVSRRPHVVGLAMQFQHRATAHVGLARRLRELGYAGHITCGGQHPTMAHQELLADVPAIDSVVLHEGEQTIVELVAALESGRSLATVSGLAIRGPDGVPTRTPPRALSNGLDELPFAHRYRPHLRHLGLPFIPIWGSRGCWGSCAFCSITTADREAKRHAPSRLLRLRSVENLAAEMAALWHREQSPTIFCFHDDTLLLPRPEDSLERLRSLRRTLDELGVGEVGIVGKCRPDCVTPELALALRRLGVFRMFVGIENASQAGLDHLNRRTTTEQLNQALAAFAEAGIYACFNLLLFEPDAKLEHVLENIAFMRAHPEFPVNFCRAEAYHGTPLHERLSRRGALIGNYLGWDYRILDDRSELAFRISAAVFRERNFDPVGVANRYIGTAYQAQLLKTFFDCSGSEERRVLQRSRELVVAITRESADFLERIVEVAERADLADADAIVRCTARLGLELTACNRHWHAELDELEASIRLCAERNQKMRSPRRLPERARALFQQMTMAGCLVTSLPGCGGAADDGSDNTTGGSIDDAGGTTASGGRATGGKAAGGMVDTAPTGGRATGGWVSSDGGAPPIGGHATGGRAIGGYTVVDMAPTGGRATGGWISDPGGTTATGGRAMGGMLGDGGVSPTGGRSSTSTGKGGTGGVDSVPIGGRATGGMTVNDPVPTGGRATGGYRAGGGGDWAPSGGRATGGMTVVDMAPTGGRGVGGTYGDGGVPPTAGNAGLHAANDALINPAPATSTAGFVGDPAIGSDYLTVGANLVSPGFTMSAGVCTSSEPATMSGTEADPQPDCTAVVDPPPPPRSAMSRVGDRPNLATAEPTEHWRNTQTTRLPRSKDLPLWDPPEVTLRAEAENGSVAVGLCTSDTCVSARWQGEGIVDSNETGARWQPTSRDDQITVCVRSEGGVAFATLRAADVPGFNAG